jgi:cytidylate kinase
MVATVETVSCSEAACCSVRLDRSWLPAAISVDAVKIDSTELPLSQVVQQIEDLVQSRRRA